MKRDQDGLLVRQRILDVYSKRGFASIDPSDLRGRFRWWGLYTQRKPGIDGGKTGSLPPEELDDEFFMLRIRIPGGQLSAEQLRAVGTLAQRYGRDVADITDRQNVQLHWVRIEDVPDIWATLDDVGLSTVEACGDTPRNMLGCPLAGVAADEVLDATEALETTNRRYAGDPTFSNLPRKYKTSISGCAHHCTAHEVNDVAFVGVVGPDGTPGFDLWVGGGLSTNPMLAQRLGAFVTAEQVPEVWAGVTALFRDYGYRRLRNRARLKFLVADWGPERVRAVLQKEFLGWALPDGPAPPPPRDGRRDHVRVHRQRDGRCYVGAAPRAGRTSGSELVAVADAAQRHGSGRVRLTAEQKLVVLDVAEQEVPALVDALAALDLVTGASTFRRGTMACTGIEFCKLAIVETKARARDLVEELERRLPAYDEPISINLNGCPNSCARFQLADIGLKGSLVPGPDGTPVEGYQVHLGGHLGMEASFGRKVRGLKLAADELPDYVERMVRRFTAARLPGETFAAWTTRAAEEDLS
ncbi:MAG TPA: nitrite/sulfite reductase [Mycobacteriales bacterium]|nr:nitrite/sulfite reductase [Mycobacteriales bacterium]